MLCAKEMNIPQVSEYMEQMGITDDDIEQMSDQMMELMDGDGFEMAEPARCLRTYRIYSTGS